MKKKPHTHLQKNPKSNVQTKGPLDKPEGDQYKNLSWSNVLHNIGSDRLCVSPAGIECWYVLLVSL